MINTYSFNPINPRCYGNEQEDDMFWYEVDNCVDELLLQEYFSNHNEEGDKDASTRRTRQTNEEV